MKRCFSGLIGFALLAGGFGLASAQPRAAAPKKGTAWSTIRTYRDSRGNAVTFPLGDRSFADEVVSFQPGKLHGPEAVSQPEAALGPPDYPPPDRSERNYVTLGCGGVLTLRFADNALLDVNGPDLFVFEAGEDIEPMLLEISLDGETWVDVGRIGGTVAVVDISPFVKRGDVFRYVRLTDSKDGCLSRYPGADIDAVGAIGGGLRISLKSSVLFDFGKSELKQGARLELHTAAAKLRAFPTAKVVVEGHTDAIGSAEANSKLSLARAESVRQYLEKFEGITGLDIKGYGPTRPVASNATEEGRERNRRVELLILPPKG